jgi:hypothetical protein
LNGLSYIVLIQPVLERFTLVVKRVKGELRCTIGLLAEERGDSDLARRGKPAYPVVN